MVRHLLAETVVNEATLDLQRVQCHYRILVVELASGRKQSVRPMGQPHLRLVFVGMVTLLVAIPCRGEGEKTWTPHAVAAMAFDDPAIRVALLEARAQVGPRMSIGGALAHVAADDGFEEVQLRIHATATASMRGWTLDNRHLVSLGTDSNERYRIRLRAISPVLFRNSKLSFRAFDELFVDLERNRQIRNNLAAGVGLGLGGRGTVELYQVWSREQRGGNSNYVLAIFTLRAKR